MSQVSRPGIKVLLVNPTFVMYMHPWPPLGLAYLAAALRNAGHQVCILNPTPSRPALQIDFAPDLIGISVVSTMREPALRVAEQFRRQLPAPIVVGGPDVTSSWAELLKSPVIDYAVLGEGELTLLEMADRLAAGASPVGIAGTVSKQDSQPVVHPQRELMRNLDDVPLPARDLLDMDYYAKQIVVRGTALGGTTVMSARGCPRKCIFCDSRRTWGRSYRPHSVDRVVEELSLLRKNYGISVFEFLDDTFAVQPQRTIELCQRLARELPGIQWGCQARVGEDKEEVLQAMREGGCVQMEFGVESGSQRILDFLHKGFSVDQVRDTFALCRKHGIRTFANFIIGTPHETLEDVECSLRLCRELRPSVADMWVAAPYPGTDLFNYCVQNQMLAADYDVGHAQHGPRPERRYYIRSELSEADINQSMQRFYAMLPEIGTNTHEFGRPAPAAH